LTRRPRVPATRKQNALYILPSIPDELSPELKDGLAIRNACATEGVCTGCGAVGVLSADAEYEGIFHYTFQHEPSCGALTDEAA
jgi:hypothetical protein